MGECEQALSGHTGKVMSVTWSVDGTQVLSRSGNGTVRIWDTGTAEYDQVLSGHTDLVTLVAWLADGTRVVSRSFDRTNRI
jgi:WD40 repeat protein